MVEFKKFVLGKLLNVSGTHSMDAGKVKFVANGDAEFIGRTSTNYGVQGLVDSDQMPFEANAANTITISQVGTIVAQYRDTPYFTSQNIAKLSADFLTSKVALYLCVVINSWLQAAGFVGYSTVKLKDIKQQEIELPVTSTGDPDFAYMARRIDELEAQRIDELSAYLKVSGLDNTVLTDEEKDALTKKVTWKKFVLGGLFDIQKVRGVNKSGLTDPSGDENYDYITRTSRNNGVESHSGLVANRELNEVGTYSLGLLQMTFFYRECPWYAGQFVRKIVPKIDLTREQALYFLSIFNALRPKLLSVLVRNVDDVFSQQEVELPVHPDGTIDFDYMQNYITAIEKQSIKGVIAYKDKVIATTKKIVSE